MKEESSHPIRDLLIFIGALAGLYALWLYTGGPARYEANPGAFLKSPAPIDTGEAYGSIDISKRTNAEKESIFDLFTNPFRLTPIVGDERNSLIETSSSDLIGYLSSGEVETTDPDKEYLTLLARPTNKKPLLLSGLSLLNKKTGARIALPGGVLVVRQNTIQQEYPVALAPGERAVIHTGTSPVGYSFRETICSGYLDEFNAIYPKLEDQCPVPYARLNTASSTIDNACLDYIDLTPRCTTIPPRTSDQYKDLSSQCKNYISTINHNRCVSEEEQSPDFFKGTWHLFLNQPKDFISPGNTIQLIGVDGKILDTFIY